MDSSTIRFEETVPAGWNWSHVLKRHTTLRITDVEGGANVAALFYNNDERDERYNMADTLKAQHISYLGTGDVLYSDMGRILASVTADTVGWHDTISGLSTAAEVEAKYGALPYQEAKNAFHRNGCEAMLIELNKWSLGRRDLVANVNFFTKVSIDGEGGMHFEPGHSSAGDYVELRAEMNTLVVLVNLQHPMDPNRDYAPKSMQLAVRDSAPTGPDDPCRIKCEQNGRGFINTERYFL